MKPLEEIKKAIEDLASKIDVPVYLLPVYGKHELGKTDVFILRNEYFYGSRHRPIATKIEDELLFAIFEDITSHMGGLFAIEHSDNTDNERKVAHEYQLDLLEKLNPEWVKRRGAEIEEELKHFPYEDKS